MFSISLTTLDLDLGSADCVLVYRNEILNLQPDYFFTKPLFSCLYISYPSPFHDQGMINIRGVPKPLRGRIACTRREICALVLRESRSRTHVLSSDIER